MPTLPSSAATSCSCSASTAPARSASAPAARLRADTARRGARGRELGERGGGRARAAHLVQPEPLDGRLAARAWPRRRVHHPVECQPLLARDRAEDLLVARAVRGGLLAEVHHELLHLQLQQPRGRDQRASALPLLQQRIRVGAALRVDLAERADLGVDVLARGDELVPNYPAHLLPLHLVQRRRDVLPEEALLLGRLLHQLPHESTAPILPRVPGPPRSLPRGRVSRATDWREIAALRSLPTCARVLEGERDRCALSERARNGRPRRVRADEAVQRVAG